MSSIGAVFGLVSFGVSLAAVAAILRQLGAGGVAKGLFAATLAFFALVILATYGPILLSGV